MVHTIYEPGGNPLKQRFSTQTALAPVYYIFFGPPPVFEELQKVVPYEGIFYPTFQKRKAVK